VRELDGARIGTLRDIVVNSAGAVTGLVVAEGGLLDGREFRVPWVLAQLKPAYVAVPAQGASAGATRATGSRVYPRHGEWRLTDFLDDVVQIERGVRYAAVEDLIITPWGEVRAIVVDAGAPGLQSYPWTRRGSEVGALRPFDYGRLGIASPR
jgi:sporulation protein YlmC with PRC-barrel domain